MRNLITGVVFTAMVMVGAPLSALDGEDDIYEITGFGPTSCFIERRVNFLNSDARVRLYSSGTYYPSGGSYWARGNVSNSNRGQITTGMIATCLGIDASDVTIIKNQGADAASFGSQEYLGFSFTLGENDDLPAGTYAYYVGDWPDTVDFKNESPTEQSNDADADLTASATVTEPVSLDTTIDSVENAIDLFDFAISDGGSADGLATTVSQIVVNVSGTASDAQRDQITWRLDGPGASNITGTYSPANDTITFSSLSISVADGGYETYTINGYFNDNTNLTEDLTIILSLNGDTDVTADASGTQFGSTSAVNNGSGTTINVTATTLAFTTQPAGSTSGSSLTTQPVVTAQDAAGNTDTDFTGTVTLTESAAGTLSGSSSMSAANGVASFTGLIYTATADQQDFTLTASSGTLSSATANTIKSNVVATTLAFTTQPAPTSFPGKQAVTFTTVPVVQAVDTNSVVDTDFTGTVSLAEVAGAGSATFSNESVSAVAGVATFTGLGLTYTNSGSTTETFKLEASATGLSSVQSSELTARLAPSVTGVSSSTSDGSYKAGETVSIQVTFSDEVTVSGTPQLTLETGTTDRTATYVSGSGTSSLTFTYTIQAGDASADLDYASTGALATNGGTIRSKADTDVDAILTLAAPGASGSLGAAKALVVDTSTPSGYSVSLGQTSINKSNETSVSFTFANAEVGVNYSYTISSSGGGTNVMGDGTIATATDQITGIDVSGLADGTLTLSVTLTDAANNQGDASNKTITKDTVAPAASISGASLTNSAFTATITFKEGDTAVALADGSFTVEDITVSKAALSEFKKTADGTYTVLVTPSGTDPVTLDVSAGVATDVAGNKNTAATQLSTTVDTSTPTVMLTSKASSPHSGKFVVTATFSEAVTGFELGDVTVGNGTASNFQSTSATVYTFDITPTADGAVTIDVAANVAEDTATNGNAAATQLSVTTDGTAPTVAITGPTDVVTEEFTVTVTFSEEVTGFTVDDITVANGTKGKFSETTAGKVYTLAITPDLGATVEISIAANVAEDTAGNGNEASNTLEVSAGSPASEFAENEAEIREVIVDDAQRSLNATLGANRRMSEQARGRFIEARRDQDGNGFVSRNDVPFDVDGLLRVDGTTLSTRGDFFAQQGSMDGSSRRLFFGDFDIQRDGDSGSTTATVTARVAWERMLSDSTMFGYFVGGELAFSDFEGAFTGDQERVGATIGLYAVHALDEQVYLDGFLTFGAGRNNLEMANDVLELESNYTTRTATAGAALTGVYEYERYEFRPELAFSYGYTWIGNVGFTGRAYGLVDDTLSLDAGDVSIANLTLRPEVIWALDADTVSASRSQLSFAPRAICERTITTVRTENCGGGAELGLSSISEDGLSTAEFRIIMDRVGSNNRSSFALNLEHRF